MALNYASIEVEHREILLKDKPQAMLTASAKGTVPVLVLADQVIDESIDVMRWVLTQNDPDSWLVDELEHQLICENDGTFKQNLDQYKYHDRYPEQSQQHYLEQCLVFLNRLERSLVQGPRVKEQGTFFLISSHVTVLDVAIFPFVRQLAYVNKNAFDQLDFPKLHIWLDYFLNSDLFLDVMEKWPLWQSDIV